MTTLRMSSLPRALRCPASTRPVPTPLTIERRSSASDLGTAVHRALELHVLGEDCDLQAVCGEHAVAVEDAEPLIGVGKAWWRRLQEFFPEPKTETTLRSDLLSELIGCEVVGHCDVMSVAGTHVAILDWKSGWGDYDYEAQQAAYAIAAMEMTKAETATATVVSLRFGKSYTYEFTPHRAFEFGQRVASRLADRDVFSPGEHCALCPHATTCEAHQEQTRGVVASISADDSLQGLLTRLADPQTRDLAGPDAKRMLDMVRVIESRCETIRGAIKAELQARGPIVTEGGKELRIVTTRRDSIDLAAAMASLRKHGLTDKDINRAATLSKQKVTQSVRDNAPHGKKGEAVDALLADLKADGAVMTAHIPTMREVSCDDE